MEMVVFILSGLASVVAVLAAVMGKRRSHEIESIRIRYDGQELIVTKDSSQTQRQKAHKILDEFAA